MRAVAGDLHLPADCRQPAADRTGLCHRRHRLSRPRHAGPASLSGRVERSARRNRFRARGTNLPGMNNHRYAVWGHSQGGQAALFTGMISKDYAPELELLGLAAAAPATDLATLMTDDLNTTGGRNLTAMTVWSWSRVYNAAMDSVVAPAVMPVVDRLAEECIESPFDILIRARTAAPLAQEFLTVKNPAETEPWHSLLVRNTPGLLPRSVPVFLAQGTSDGLVRPAVTMDYMKRLCRAGSRVRMLTLPGVSHGFAGAKSADEAVAWISDRFAGRPAPNDCGG
ncbi:MAG TPA: lipase family protein [Bradyrhizobium sp.]|nr:lipase family protein [Bradyrhizobium sp.]